MTILLKQIFGLFKLLNSDKGTISIAAGLALGFILGMAPVFSLQTVLVILMIFFFRVQMGAAFIGAFFFAFIAYLLDPVFHKIGTVILTQGALEGLFTAMYHMPIVPLTRFNNTVVMGAGVVSIFLAPVVFFLSKVLIQKYREKIVARFQNSKAFKAFKTTAFYKWYAKYDELFGT